MNKNPNYYFYPEKQVQWNGKNFTRKTAFAGVIVNNALQIGMSECSNKDIFDKKLGKKIAEGRALKKPSIVITLDNKFEAKLADVFINACKEHLKCEQSIVI